MAILSREELKRQILEFPEAMSSTLDELLDHYDAGTISRERVVENIKRSVETVFNTFAESVNISLEKNDDMWGGAFD